MWVNSRKICEKRKYIWFNDFLQDWFSFLIVIHIPNRRLIVET